MVALKFVGAFGATIGVACADVETTPGPTELTPRNAIVYPTPLVRPVIVAGLRVIGGSKAIQLIPPLRLY